MNAKANHTRLFHTYFPWRPTSSPSALFAIAFAGVVVVVVADAGAVAVAAAALSSFKDLVWECGQGRETGEAGSCLELRVNESARQKWLARRRDWTDVRWVVESKSRR